MIEINLLREQEGIAEGFESEELSYTYILIGVVLVAIIAFGLFIFHRRTLNRIERLKAEIQKLEEEKQALQEYLDRVKKKKKEKKDAENRFQAIESLAKARTQPVHILMDLASSISDLAWLTQFEYKGTTFQIHGGAKQERAITELVDQLNASPYFANVLIIEVKSQRQDQEFQFIIRGDVTNPLMGIPSASLK